MKIEGKNRDICRLILVRSLEFVRPTYGLSFFVRYGVALKLGKVSALYFENRPPLHEEGEGLRGRD